MVRRWVVLLALCAFTAALVGCSNEPEVVGPPGPYDLTDVVDALEAAGIAVVSGDTLDAGETGTAELTVDDSATGDSTTFEVTVHQDEEAASEVDDAYRFGNLTSPDLNESIEVEYNVVGALRDALGS